MPIYVGNQKINVSGVKKVYVGTQSVYANKSWVTLWSGTKTIESRSTMLQGTSYNFCQTVADTGNTPTIRITYSKLTGSASSPSVIKYYNNSTSVSPNVSSKPTSPVTITLDEANTVYVLGIQAKTTDSGANSVYLYKSNNGTSNCNLSLSGGVNSAVSNYAVLTITKIEQYC